MKKSNKLLLGGFLTVMLMITGIHIALFAKFKSGNYTLYRPEERKNERMQSFKNVSFVIVRNVRGAAIQFGDTAEVEKVDEDLIKYIQNGDSLVIIGRNQFVELDERRRVIVTVPRNAALYAVNSFLFFGKGNKDAENNPVINLQNSNAFFHDEGDFGQLSIVTDSISRLSLQSKHLLKAKITTTANNP